MSTITESVRRVPMGWDDYLRLDDTTRGEYYGGALVMTPGPTRQHQNICVWLTVHLRDAVPTGMDVSLGWGWSPAGTHTEYIPDVMVHPATQESTRFTGIPLLAVEVLSTNRRDDLVEKATAYAARGLRDYWIVDPRDHVLMAYALVDGMYELRSEHTEGVAALTFADVAVALDLGALFA